MQQELMNNMAELNAAALDSFRKLSAIGFEAYEAAARQQMEVANTMLEAGTKQAELARKMPEIKDVSDLASEQGDLLKATAEKLVANAQESAKLANETRESLMGWYEAGVEKAMDMAQTQAKAFEEKNEAA